MIEECKDSKYVLNYYNLECISSKVKSNILEPLDSDFIVEPAECVESPTDYWLRITKDGCFIKK